MILRDKGVGALIVSNDGQHIDGIISERDVVRALANHGASVLGRAVASAMSKDVVTCRTGDAVESLRVLRLGRQDPEKREGEQRTKQEGAHGKCRCGHGRGSGSGELSPLRTSGGGTR